MIALELQQQTPEWFAARCGVPSASNFDKIVTTKGEPSKQAQKYLWQLAGERVTGKQEESFTSGHMQRGIELEAEARQFYELVSDVVVQTVGICYPNENKKYSCSPDGLVGEDGGLEIKCPSMAVHVGYLIEGVLPTEYFQQVQGNLLVTGRKWWDFVSYYPGLKPLMLRVYRDEEFIKKLDLALENFCEELDAVTKRIIQ